MPDFRCAWVEMSDHAWIYGFSEIVPAGIWGGQVGQQFEDTWSLVLTCIRPEARERRNRLEKYSRYWMHKTWRLTVRSKEKVRIQDDS